MVLKLGADPVNNLIGSVSTDCWKSWIFGSVVFSENKGSEADLYIS